MSSKKAIGQRTLMGFDFGTKSIGIAIGQEVSGTASPLSAVPAKDGIPNWDSIKRVLDDWQPDLLVVGLPLNMDGTNQEVTFKAKKFAKRLHGMFGYTVEVHDERLTTTDAKARLFDEGGYRNLEKGNVDSMSAQIILESYFESLYE